MHHDITTILWFASLSWVLDAIQPSFDITFLIECYLNAYYVPGTVLG